MMMSCVIGKGWNNCGQIIAKRGRLRSISLHPPVASLTSWHRTITNLQQSESTTVATDDAATRHGHAACNRHIYPCNSNMMTTRMMIQRITVQPTAAARLFSSAAAQGDDNSDESFSSSTQVDFFEVLNIPRRFAIDEEEMKSNYRSLMGELHPDKHTIKSIDEKQFIDDQASRVTHAYQILKFPHERAVHLLELVNHPMEETSKGNLVGNMFLMEMMEFRETIDSIVNDKNDDDSVKHKKLQEMLHKAEQEIDSLCNELDAAFHDESYDNAIELTAKLQYWNRIEETINEKL